MLTPDTALATLDQLLTAARRAGADAADAVAVGDVSLSVEVREGRLEDVSRSESTGVGLRVFVGRRSASASSSALDAASLAMLVERTVAMAKVAPEDAFAGLAEPALLARDFPELDLLDLGEPAPESLRDAALAGEAAALGVEGVTASHGASMSAGHSLMALATTTGFAGAKRSSSFSRSVVAQAGEGARMQRDWASRSARHLADLDSPEAVGRLAGTRAVEKLDPVKPKSAAMPVVYDPRVSGSLLSHLVGAINGAAVARGASFLRGRLGQRIFAPGITVIDDPHRVRGLRSRAFDGEGLPTAETRLIDGGVLTQWIADSAAARQLGIAPTGHATRGLSGAPGAGPSNLHMAPGPVTPGALIADIPLGFYVTELLGSSVNPLTGDYSRGASGRLIENGRLTGAVAEVTIAGNLIDMFARAMPANDLEFRQAVNAPTLRIDGMTLAGD